MKGYLASSLLFLGFASLSSGDAFKFSLNKGLNVDLLNHDGSELYTEITLGTPPQSFMTVLDMGYSGLWIPSSECKAIPCRSHNQYDSANSSTYGEDGSKFKVKHTIGTASGFLSKDKLCFGSTCIQEHKFGEATSESFIPFANAVHDGVLGMGFEKDSILSALVDKKIIEKALFSIWLNKNPLTKNQKSQMILGGIDSSLYEGNISYIPLSSESVWRTKMKSISIKGSHRGCGYGTKPGCEVTFDVGSKFIYGPFMEAKTINRWIGATQLMASYGYYKVRCNEILTLPTVEFVFEGQSFKLKPQDYIVETYIVGSKVCLSGFVGLAEQEKPQWILGANFLSAYYSIYDVENKKIGLAASQRKDVE